MNNHNNKLHEYKNKIVYIESFYVDFLLRTWLIS